MGHEPDIGALAASLIGARRPLVFKKGAICRIDVTSLPPARGGTLVWFVTPKMLRKHRDRARRAVGVRVGTATGR